MLTIDPNQQELLIKQSREFADARGFKFDIAYYTPKGENFLIDLRRKDIEVIIANAMFHSDDFDVDFYDSDCIRPSAASDTIELAADLESHLREIPGAKFTEER
jgi:hypothetical protein